MFIKQEQYLKTNEEFEQSYFKDLLEEYEQAPEFCEPLLMVANSGDGRQRVSGFYFEICRCFVDKLVSLQRALVYKAGNICFSAVFYCLGGELVAVFSIVCPRPMSHTT
ncbi:unnamed protein product [Caenorhabditis brenneri]